MVIPSHTTHKTETDKQGYRGASSIIPSEYCNQCGKYTTHLSYDRGSSEIHECLECHYQQWFTVR